MWTLAPICDRIQSIRDLPRAAIVARRFCLFHKNLPRRSRAVNGVEAERFCRGTPGKAGNQPARGGAGGMVEIGFYQIGNELPRLAFGEQRHWRFQ